MAVLSPGSSTALSQITRSNGILLLDQSAAPSHWPKIFCYMLTYRLISKHFPSQKSSSAHLRVLTYESEYTVEAPLSSNHFTAGLRINCWRTGSEDFSFSWLAEHWSKHQTLSDAHLNLGPDPSICFFFAWALTFHDHTIRWSQIHAASTVVPNQWNLCSEGYFSSGHRVCGKTAEYLCWLQSKLMKQSKSE